MKTIKIVTDVKFDERRNEVLYRLETKTLTFDDEGKLVQVQDGTRESGRVMKIETISL